MSDPAILDVSAIMTRDPITVTPATGLDEALQLMADEDVRHLPVAEQGRLLGIVSERDLLGSVGWLPRRGRGPAQAQCVGDVMHADAATASPGDTVVMACVAFQVERIGCLPVLDGGRLVGIVTETDVLAAYWRACRDGHLDGDVDPPAREHMSTRLTTIADSTDLRDAVDHSRRMHGRHLPVMRGPRLVGIVSDRDLRAAHGAGRPGDTPISELMSADVITIGPDEPLSAAARTMVEQKLGALPVLDGGRLVGILTLTDVVEHCLSTLREPDASGA